MLLFADDVVIGDVADDALIKNPAKGMPIVTLNLSM